MVELDLAPLVPEARHVAAAAAGIYLSHTRPWFIGLLVHGSALKGGVIPGCSDIDFVLYLDDAAFEADELRLDIALAIQRGLSVIDPVPFQYIQCYAYPPRNDRPDHGILGPVPGAYHLLAGSLPVPEATLEEAIARAQALLHSGRAYRGDHLLEHGGGRLERTARLVCTDVWPTLFSFLLLRERDLSVWRLTKEQAIVRLPSPVRESADAFLRRVRDYYAHGTGIDGALAVIEQGATTIRLARVANRELV